MARARADVIGAAGRAAFEDQPVGANRVAHVGEIAARVEVADGDLRLPPAGLDVGNAARKSGRGEEPDPDAGQCG